jgi:hypothetical protein
MRYATPQKLLQCVRNHKIIILFKLSRDIVDRLSWGNENNRNSLKAIAKEEQEEITF